jgi:tetratricopeptide (TPR) repeat protein
MDAQEIRMSKESLKLCLDVVQEARVCLSADLARHPNYADLHHMNALLQIAQGQMAVAETALQRALDINPRYAAARSTLGHVYLTRGRYDQASEIFGALGPDDPTGTAGQYGLALVCLGRGRLDDAQGAIEECMRLTGRQVPWLHQLGVIHRHKGEVAEALTAWREAASDSLVARFYDRAGLSESGDVDADCLDRLETLVPVHPGLADLEDYYGRICARTRLWNEAAEAYRRAYLTEGVAARFYMRSGFVASLKGEDAEALAAYVSAVEADSRYAPARVALGFEYAAQGDAGRAIEQFEEAAHLRPRWPDVQYNLGLLYAAETREDDALERFRTALSINPSYAHAQASVAFTCYKLGHVAEARKEFERAITLGIRSSDLFVHMALCHRDLGDMNRAVEILNEAVALNPGDETAHYHLGFIHQQRGARRKAMAAWRTFLTLAQKGPLYEEVQAQLRNGTDD